MLVKLLVELIGTFVFLAVIIKMVKQFRLVLPLLPPYFGRFSIWRTL